MPRSSPLSPRHSHGHHFTGKTSRSTRRERERRKRRRSRSPGTRRRDSRSPRSHRPRSRRRHSPSRDRGGKQRHDTPSRPPAPPPTPLTERKRKKAKKKEKKEKKVKKNKKKKKKEELQTSRLSFDGGDSEEEGWKEKEGKVVKWIGDIQERSKSGKRRRLVPSILQSESPQNLLNLTQGSDLFVKASVSSTRLGPIGLGAVLEKGPRPYMEDRHVAKAFLFPESEGLTPCALAGIFDGHGGPRAASYASSRLVELLQRSKKLKKALRGGVDGSEKVKYLSKALEDSIQQIEEEVLEMGRSNCTFDKNAWNDGTTLCCSLLTGTDLVVANVGDSRIVLGREHDSIRLSTDHKPDHPDEKKRVEEAGGSIMFSGCWRVDHPKLTVRLACSRSIGDWKFKDTGVVSASPDIRLFKLQPSDQFLIIASDGLWDVFSDDSAVAIVREKLEPVLKTSSVPPYSELQRRSTEAAGTIVRKALELGAMDNVSVVIVSLFWIRDS
ncbi:hypothetical protein AAMO2058_000324400 [Amorphochlora amoebiformis]